MGPLIITTRTGRPLRLLHGGDVEQLEAVYLAHQDGELWAVGRTETDARKAAHVTACAAVFRPLEADADADLQLWAGGLEVLRVEIPPGTWPLFLRLLGAPPEAA